MAEPKVCPFYFRNECFAEGVTEDCKNPSNYKQCSIYAGRYFIDTLPLPKICPLIHICHAKAKTVHIEPIRHQEDDCPCKSQGVLSPSNLSLEYTDYRSCLIFSKWFWEQRRKNESKM